MRGEKIYNRIAVLREEHGLSRKDLADKVGVNFQTIGYLERGEYNPSLDLAMDLCAVFSLPIEIVFSRQPMRPLSEELATLKQKLQ
ncbi:helix-turn-helix transcriptional regulator [Fibrella aquatica]|jgi:putative transcriptional regulator|uniref:helix-turn-helix transcriptional regulator n=1 Tax=Fibrella aquatica TaxID=3242487 RepID=UPI003521DBDE